MKKTLLLAGLLAFTMSSAMAEPPMPPVDGKCPPKFEEGKYPPPPCGKFQPPPPPRGERPDHKKADFEKKLNLTEEQKAQAKEIRQKGHEQMKPIFDKMTALKKEAKKVSSNTKLTEEQKAKKLAEIRKSTHELQKEARDIRIQNMQEFEAILTKKQKKTLEKMKKQGRKDFQKAHPKQHPWDKKPCKCNCNCQ